MNGCRNPNRIEAGGVPLTVTGARDSGDWRPGRRAPKPLPLGRRLVALARRLVP